MNDSLFHRAPAAYIHDPAARARTLYELIACAQESILFQMYLFAGNDELATLRPVPDSFPWARLLVQWFVERRRLSPHLDIAVILDTQTPDDPTLTYKGEGPLARHLLEDAGIPVLNANLFGTRFNHRRRFPPVAGFHRKAPSETHQADWVRTQQRWQTLHNVEDHRKNLVIDRGAWGAVMSHNTIDAAARWHENLFLMGAPAAGDLWNESAQALSRALEIPQRLDERTRDSLERLALQPGREKEDSNIESFRNSPPVTLRSLGNPDVSPDLRHRRIKIISNTAIRGEITRALGELQAGDGVAIATTYFSDMAMLNALENLGKEISVRVLIDDCAGLPLNAFLSWVVRTFANLRCMIRGRRNGFALRIHSSRGKPMMHMKTAAFSYREREPLLIGGQANYTPNSFSGAWLETDVVVRDEDMVREFLEQFDLLWAAAGPAGSSEDDAAGFFLGILRKASRKFREKILLGILLILENLGFRP